MWILRHYRIYTKGPLSLIFSPILLIIGMVFAHLHEQCMTQHIDLGELILKSHLSTLPQIWKQVVILDTGSLWVFLTYIQGVVRNHFHTGFYPSTFGALEIIW